MVRASGTARRMSALVDPFGRPFPKSQPAYDGGSWGRRVASFSAPNTGINASLAGSLDVMRARVRALVRNTPLMRKIVNALVSNLIGTGFTMVPQTGDETLDRAQKALWRDFADSRRADADGRTNFHGLAVLAVRSWAVAGEAILRLRPRRLSDGLPVPLQVQAIAPDQLPTDFMRTLANGNEVVSGVEYGPLGERVNYWLTPRHPADVALNLKALTNEPKPVPADAVLHVFEPIEPGQVRGEPPLAAAILKAHRLDLHDEAQLERQLVAALFASFFVSPDGDLASIGDTDAEAAGPTAQGELEIPYQPGSVGIAPPGYDFKSTDPPQLAAEYATFQKLQRQDLAGCGRVTYEQATGDYAGVTYSSCRAGLNEQHRECEQLQFTMIGPQVYAAVWEQVMRLGAAVGRLPVDAKAFAADPYPFLRVRCIPQGWKHVDPDSEFNALQTAIQAHITSRDDVIAEQGWDPEDVDQARAKGLAREKALGLPPTEVDPATLVPAAPGRTPADRAAGRTARGG